MIRDKTGKQFTFYEFFGVPEGVPQNELKSAYKKLCLKFHPDRNGGDKKSEANFKVVQQAWGVLGDPARRRNYDGKLAIMRGRMQPRMNVTVVFYPADDGTSNWTTNVSFF